MATEKTFTVAGTATNADGTVKVRFANDLVARIKILNKNNCTNINLMELPKAMTKLEALQHLQSLGQTGDAGYAVANNSDQIRLHFIVHAKLKPKVIQSSYEQNFYS